MRNANLFRIGENPLQIRGSDPIGEILNEKRLRVIAAEVPTAGCSSSSAAASATASVVVGFGSAGAGFFHSVLVIASSHCLLDVVIGLKVGEAGLASVSDTDEEDSALFQPFFRRILVVESSHEDSVTLLCLSVFHFGLLGWGGGRSLLLPLLSRFFRRSCGCFFFFFVITFFFFAIIFLIIILFIIIVIVVVFIIIFLL